MPGEVPAVRAARLGLRLDLPPSARDLRLDLPRSPQAAADLIQRLLEPTVAARLGCGQRGAAGVREHVFLAAGMAWGELLAKRLPAPWVPQLASATDTSNFDEYGAEETPWAGEDLSRVTLSADERAAFEDF